MPTSAKPRSAPSPDRDLFDRIERAVRVRAQLRGDLEHEVEELLADICTQPDEFLAELADHFATEAERWFKACGLSTDAPGVNSRANPGPRGGAPDSPR